MQLDLKESNRLHDVIKEVFGNLNNKTIQNISKLFKYPFKSLPQKEAIEERFKFSRLEILGDSIIRQYVLERLLDKNPDLKGGDISILVSSLVSKYSMARIFINLKLNYFVFVDGMVEAYLAKIYADIIESLVGTVYVMEGWDSVKKNVLNIIYSNEELEQEHKKSCKSNLIEVCQKFNYTNKIVNKRILEYSSPLYATIVILTINSKTHYFYGVNVNKKLSEQNACMKALKMLSIRHSKIFLTQETKRLSNKESN